MLFLLDLVFAIDRRLRERALEIERARHQQIAEARAQLLAELRSIDSPERRMKAP
jgi:hypothetical protein